MSASVSLSQGVQVVRCGARALSVMALSVGRSALSAIPLPPPMSPVEFDGIALLEGLLGEGGAIAPCVPDHHKAEVRLL